MTWGTPGSAPDDPTDVEHPIVPGGQFEGLAAGDEVVVEPAREDEPILVDGYLMRVEPEPRRILAGITQGEVARPEWVRHPIVLWEMVERAQRAMLLATWRIALATPRILPRGLWWSLRGATRLLGQLASWLWDGEMNPAWGDRQATDEKTAIRMVNMRQQRQRFRWSAVALTLLVGLVVGWKLWEQSHYLFWGAACALLVPLAVAGRPEGEYLLTPGLQHHEQPRLTTQNIIRGLGSLGIASLTRSLDKMDTSRLWRSDIVGIKGGYRIWIQLPHGTVAEDLVEHEQRFAAALGRPEDCVIVEPRPDITPGDLYLYVFDKPMLSSDLGPGPLATAKRTSWFDPVALGKTRLGRPHPEHLSGGAWFAGGQPNSGKSSLCRLAAAHTALDPHARLLISNLKGSPDFTALKPVCHRYISGAPEQDPIVLEQTLDMIRWVIEEAGRRNQFLTQLIERGEASTAEATKELAAKYPEQLGGITAIFDEVHRLFDKADFDQADEAARLMGVAIKAVRSAGINITDSTQLAGGDVVPKALTRASRLRGCLRVMEEVSFRQIFGQAGAGLFAQFRVARFRQGTILLRSDDGAPLMVGLHYITLPMLAQIGKRALEARERLHLLTGEAAGEQFEMPDREDPSLLLHDVLVAIPVAEPRRTKRDESQAWLHALEQQIDPDRAPGWMAAELKVRGVKVKRQMNRSRMQDGERVQDNYPGVETGEIRRALEAMDVAEEALQGGESRSAHDAHLASISPSNAA